MPDSLINSRPISTYCMRKEAARVRNLVVGVNAIGGGQVTCQKWPNLGLLIAECAIAGRNVSRRPLDLPGHTLIASRVKSNLIRERVVFRSDAPSRRVSHCAHLGRCNDAMLLFRVTGKAEF